MGPVVTEAACDRILGVIERATAERGGHAAHRRAPARGRPRRRLLHRSDRVRRGRPRQRPGAQRGLRPGALRCCASATRTRSCAKANDSRYGLAAYLHTARLAACPPARRPLRGRIGHGERVPPGSRRPRRSAATSRAGSAARRAAPASRSSSGRRTSTSATDGPWPASRRSGSSTGDAPRGDTSGRSRGAGPTMKFVDDAQFGTFRLSTWPSPPRGMTVTWMVRLGGVDAGRETSAPEMKGRPANAADRCAEVGDAVETVVEGEQRVEPLGARGDGRGEEVLAVDGEHVVLRALVAPQLLVADEDEVGRRRALLAERVEAGARLLGEQADQAVAADERLEVEVVGRAGEHDGELVVLVAAARRTGPTSRRLRSRTWPSGGGPCGTPCGRRPPRSAASCPPLPRWTGTAGPAREHHVPLGDDVGRLRRVAGEERYIASNVSAEVAT